MHVHMYACRCTRARSAHTLEVLATPGGARPSSDAGMRTCVHVCMTRCRLQSRDLLHKWNKESRLSAIGQCFPGFQQRLGGAPFELIEDQSEVKQAPGAAAAPSQVSPRMLHD